MNCGDIEENPGVLDQCYSNNNFVTMLEVSETWTVTKMDDISVLLIRSDNQ